MNAKEKVIQYMQSQSVGTTTKSIDYQTLMDDLGFGFYEMLDVIEQLVDEGILIPKIG